MKFIEILSSNSELSLELDTIEWEATNYSFEWNKGDKFKTEGLKHFAKILNSEAQFNQLGNITLQDNSITYEELEEFTSACAGYCAVSKDKIWFDWEYNRVKD